MTKRKPTEGHKMRTCYGVVTRCECGWHSATWFGPGSRGSAVAEWHSHIEKVHAEKEEWKS